MLKIIIFVRLFLSVGLFSTAALPGYASTDLEKMFEIQAEQYLMTSASEDVSIPLAVSKIEEEPRLVTQPDPQATTPSYQVTHLPVSYSGGGLLSAARSQIGIQQDCTAMVENALRMLGYSVGDLGPMDFARYGTQVSPSEAQPGDIMMRYGHVAIYAGNGMAVHGGVPAFGGTVEFQYSSNPHEYAVIVRV